MISYRNHQRQESYTIKVTSETKENIHKLFQSVYQTNVDDANIKQTKSESYQVIKDSEGNIDKMLYKLVLYSQNTQIVIESQYRLYFITNYTITSLPKFDALFVNDMTMNTNLNRHLKERINKDKNPGIIEKVHAEWVERLASGYFKKRSSLNSQLHNLIVRTTNSKGA